MGASAHRLGDPQHAALVPAHGPRRSASPAWRSRVWGPLWRFTVASAIGQLVGVGVTALAVAVTRGPSGVLRDGLAASMVVSVLVAGVVQGGLLGFAQSRVLRLYLPWLSGTAWTAATAIGTGLAWLFALSAVQMFMRAPPDLPVMTSVVAVVAMGGLALGAIVGVSQWSVLRHGVPRAGIWITASAMGWAVGLVLSVAVASIPSARWPDVAVALQLSLGAMLSGCALGCACAIALVSLLARPHAEFPVYDRRWRS
jgi:hypothetical protein